MKSGKRKATDDDGASGEARATTAHATGQTVRQLSRNGSKFRRLGKLASPQMGDAYYRDLYAVEPDFRQLARHDADFAAVMKPNSQLDFSDPKTVKQLTKTLLKVDFGLKIELPDDRLCPPVPNRHNYILWLKGLLDSSSYDPPGGKLLGLDIGTGASCIYPLLGCTQRPWHFIATDVDSKSLSYAKRNVELNGLQDRIKLVSRELSDPLVPLDELKIEAIDFCMINPPFYISEDDMLSSAKKKARPPNSACTGAPVEMVCDGGEVAFVSRLLDESLVLRERVRWYTSMLGKVSSLEVLVEKLREKNIDNYAVAEFVQGNKTKRWAIGWSFGPMRPAQDVARGMKAVSWRRVLPPIVEAEVLALPFGTDIDAQVDKIHTAMGSLELISWEWDRGHFKGTGRARENVWGRAWRRKKLREKDGDLTKQDTEISEACAFGFIITISVGQEYIVTRCRWCEGHDASLFESFCGFLRGKLRSASLQDEPVGAVDSSAS